MTNTTHKRLAAHYGLTAARRPGARIDTCNGTATWDDSDVDELRGFLRVHRIDATVELAAIAARAYRAEVARYLAQLDGYAAEVL